jgi:GDSL-like Lipase/Acylhydrolase family
MGTIRHEPSVRTDRERRARLRRALTLAAVAGVLSAVAPSVANATSYVAMGDSYTAAPGVTPPSPTAPADCAQSAANYPHLVATALNLSLTDVSCSGAKTENFTVAQFPDQPPQFDALTPTTEVVTVGMGGNDHNLFGTLVAGCTALDFGKPNVGAPCRKQYEGFVRTTFQEDRGPQEAALAEIHALSPNAKVFIVGYPDITPAHGYCPTAIPWTTGDLRWFRNRVQIPGNTSLRREAQSNNAVFVNTFTPSIGHDACEPVGVRWIEPLFGSLTGVPVHPNALGEEHDAFDVEKAMLIHRVR